MERRFRTTCALALIAMLFVTVPLLMAQASITLTFEGLKDGEPVLNYYNGGTGGNGSGPGPNDGITFGSDAIAGIAISSGGSGNFAGNPSGVTIVTFLSGSGVIMNVPAGFKTGFSFYYASGSNSGTINVYDNVNGAGNILATLSLTPTGSNCNGSIYTYSCWISKGVTFNGTAKSVNFSGVTNGIGFDNITIGSSNPGTSALSITSTSLPGGTVGGAYSAALTAAGGRSPYMWSVVGLPAGLTLNDSTGGISGTPTVASASTISVTVRDSSSPQLSATANLLLSISNGPTIATASLPSGTAGAGYSAMLSASGGRMPYTWSATGLPSGLSLNSSSGVISGTPTTASTYSVPVTVRDSSSPSISATKTFSLMIGSTSTYRLVASQTAIGAITDRPSLTLQFSSPTSAPISATIALSFVGNAAGLPPNYSNPDLQFGSGGKTTIVGIPQGSTTFSLPVNDSIQVGSVAGTVTATLTQLTQISNGQALPLPNPLPSVAITVPRMAPTTTSVKIINVTSTGFTVDIVASSTPRDLSGGAILTFIAAAGAQLNDGNVSITGNGNQIATSATSWFASANGQNDGGAFDLQIPFTFSGNVGAIGSVSVQLTDSAGTSSAVVGTM